MTRIPRRIRHLLTTAAACLSAASLLASCASGQGSDNGSDTSASGHDWSVGMVNEQPDPGAPVDGGTLTFSGLTPVKSLDPSVSPASGSAGGTELTAIYDVLMRYDPVARKYSPQLAQSLGHNDDYTSWTLTLRPDVTFSDGTPVTSQAAKASIERTLAAGGLGDDVWKQKLSSIQAPDPQTVKFDLDEAWSGLPAGLSTKVGMVVAPAAYADPDNYAPIGAGPFAVDHFTPNEELVLNARQDYYGGAPHLDHLRMVSLGDQVTGDSLQSGDVDAAFSLNIDTILSLINAGLPGFVDVTPSGRLLNVNIRPGHPGSDLRVRKAIAVAIDPAAIDQRVNNGNGIPTQKLFPESSPWHDDIPSIGVDPDQARDLLQQAEADGYDGKITYLAASGPKDKTTAVAVQGMLDAVGFDVDVKYVTDNSVLVESMYIDHDYDMAASGLGVTNANPYPRLLSSLHTDGSVNSSGYSDKKMDDLLDRLGKSTDDETTQNILTDIQKRMNETLPWQPWDASPNLGVWGKNVHGVKVTYDEIMLFDDAWKS